MSSHWCYAHSSCPHGANHDRMKVNVSWSLRSATMYVLAIGRPPHLRLTSVCSLPLLGRAPLSALLLQQILCLLVSCSYPIETGFGIIDHTFIASNGVNGSGAGLCVTDCSNTRVTNSIFFNNGAALGNLLSSLRHCCCPSCKQLR